jgi:hypothetical protein
MNDASQVAAQKKLQQMRRYGSHRVKVEVRRHGSKSPLEALKAVRASLVGRLVVRDIRRAAKHVPRTAAKVDTRTWIKDEWS